MVGLSLFCCCVMASAQTEPAVAGGAATAAAAADAVTAGTTGSMTAVDRGFFLLCALLVLLMQGGFCLFALGMARAKNGIDVMMKHLIGFALVALVFLLSFPFMFGPSIDGWIGDGEWSYVWEGPPNGDMWIFWLFQVGLAGIACTLASGAMEGRTRFAGYLCGTVALAGIVYPVAGHWAWGSRGALIGMASGQGWLEQRGFHDFAGSTVVHVVGGACALAGVLVVGRRAGRFAPDGTPRLLGGHHLSMAGLGAILLLFGWFGFNAGALGSPSPALGEIVVNTLLAASIGSCSAMASRWIMDGRPDPAISMSGGLAGMVAISAGCDVVNPLAAIGIGLGGGLLANFGGLLLERIRVDDATNVVPVHLFSGLWGTWAVALFHRDGFASGLLPTQAIGSVSLGLAAFSVAFIFFKVIDLTIGLRAGGEEQGDGLDFADHAANAYPDFVTTEQG